jgi:hypothetical protein
MSEGSAIIARMTNARTLATRLADLLRREQAAMAEFLVALSDFDRQRAWVDLGYPNLFDFLHRELGMSRGAAHYRKTAAELMQKFPEIIEPLRDGRLCITSIVQLAKVLTPENCDEVLPRFFRRSKSEAMAIAAELQPAPAPPQRDLVTELVPAEPPLPAASSKSTSQPEAAGVQPVELRAPVLSPAPGSASDLAAAPPSTTPVTMPVPRDFAEPLTGKLFRLHITVSDEFLAKLEAARGALSHKLRCPNTAAVLEAALDLVLKQHAKRKGLVQKPRKAARLAKSETVPAEVKRGVWTRDDGRCQWPLESGGICGSTLRVQYDHSPTPRARGGRATKKNMRLLCRMHNDLAARQAFGDEWMNQFTRNPRHAAAARLTQGTPSG